MQDMYISGEPGTITEASIMIGFVYHPDLITDWRIDGYDQSKLQFYSSTNPMIHVSFNQVDMRTGLFSRVIRVIDAKSNPRIELSMNNFIDKNDYIGLILADPEPTTYFNLEKITMYGATWGG